MTMSVHFAEKTAFIKPLLKLKQQGNVLEKDLVILIKNLKIDSYALEDIFNFRNEVLTKSQTYSNKLLKNLRIIAAELESLKRGMEPQEELRQLDINMYKQKLMNFSQKTHDLKSTCCIQTLIEEQHLLESALREHELHSQKYNLSKGATLQPVCSNNESKEQDINNEDVHDFHTLVMKTGYTENWNKEDHLLFLKIRRKYTNIPALVTAIRNKCPHLSTEAIINHEIWYKKYVSLRAKQKSAVEVWKKRRELERIKNVKDSSKEKPYVENKKIINNTSEEERMVISKSADVQRKKGTKLNNSIDSDRRRKKELIERWKNEKENKNSKYAEELKMQLKLRDEIKEHQRQKRLEKIREALHESRQQKYLHTVVNELNENSNDKCTYNPRLIKAFRKQDEEFIKKRKDLISHVNRSNREQITNVKALKFAKTTNSCTLFNTTKAWNEKCKINNSGIEHCNKLQYIKDIPKLCTRWRNGESENLKIS